MYLRTIALESLPLAILWLASPCVVAAEPERGIAGFSQLSTERDWPWWRGPSRNGIAAAQKDVPTKWSDQESVVWRTAIPGRGHSSPILVKDRIFLTTADTGKQVHFLLANHDLAQIHGEGIMKAGMSVCEAFNAGVKRDFPGASSGVIVAITEFLLSLPLAIRSQNGLFFCHSLPTDDQIKPFDYTVFHRPLAGPDYKRRTGPVYQLIWGRNMSPDKASEFADAVGANIIITGHQPQDRGYVRNGNRHLILASDHARGVYCQLPLDQKLKIDEVEKRIRQFLTINDRGE